MTAFILLSWVIVIIAALFLVIYLAAFFYFTDLSVPVKKVYSENILAIFPHPDDEVLTCGGLISRISKGGKKVSVALLTKGEKGTPEGVEDKTLKKIRGEEALRVSRILGYHLIMRDMGDGMLDKKRSPLEKAIRDIIEEIGPDTLISYDLSGLYGHPDHMAVAESVTLVAREKGIRLLYISLPGRLYRHLRLPLHMAQDKNFLEKRAYPDFRVFIGLGATRRINALYAYKSQISSFNGSYPLAPWIVLSAVLFEYFHEVKA